MPVDWEEEDIDEDTDEDWTDEGEY